MALESLLALGGRSGNNCGATVLRKLVRAGHLGRKIGKGIYGYK